jgi:hypothetical protein
MIQPETFTRLRLLAGDKGPGGHALRPRQARPCRVPGTRSTRVTVSAAIAKSDRTREPQECWRNAT